MATNPKFFEYKDVTIYHELRDNDEQAPRMTFWYSTSPAVQDQSFDVRMLERPPDLNTSKSTAEKHKEIIKHAINRGALPGLEPKENRPVSLVGNAAAAADEAAREIDEALEIISEEDLTRTETQLLEMLKGKAESLNDELRHLESTYS